MNTEFLQSHSTATIYFKVDKVCTSDTVKNVGRCQ